MNVDLFINLVSIFNFKKKCLPLQTRAVFSELIIPLENRLDNDFKNATVSMTCLLLLLLLFFFYHLYCLERKKKYCSERHR